jgi:uncharacterized protein
MRKKEREITDPKEMIDIIERGEICRLGFCAGDEPYIVPMNYGYSDGYLYFHSAKEGRKIDLVQKNNRVCFEIEVDVTVVPEEEACRWATKYKCVIGYGTISEVHDIADKKRGLTVLMNHYQQKDIWSYVDESANRVVILKLKIDEMSGKKAT